MSGEEERIVFEAVVTDDGHCKPAAVVATRVRLQRWKGRKVLVTVSRWIKPKTLPQLAYFHSTVLPYWSEHSGYELSEAKWELKQAFLAKVKRTSRLTGEEVWEVPSLADLSSEAMSEFITRCLKEAALQGLHIPTPEEAA